MRIEVSQKTPVDGWDNGDGTVSIVFLDENQREVELVFTSISVLGRISKASDRAGRKLRASVQPPIIYGG